MSSHDYLADLPDFRDPQRKPLSDAQDAAYAAVQSIAAKLEAAGMQWDALNLTVDNGWIITDPELRDRYRAALDAEAVTSAALRDYDERTTR